MNVEDLVQQRIADARRKAEAQRAERERRKRARAYGLALRHTAKLRHLNLTAIDNSSPAASGA